MHQIFLKSYPTEKRSWISHLHKEADHYSRSQPESNNKICLNRKGSVLLGKDAVLVAAADGKCWIKTTFKFLHFNDNFNIPEPNDTPNDKLVNFCPSLDH